MSRASTLLRAARQESGLTQAELARRAGTTQSVIARMESPTSNPTVASLDDVLSALGRALSLTVPTALDEVDEDQIVKQLRLTPAQRLANHEASQRNLREMVRKAKRVPR